MCNFLPHLARLRLAPGDRRLVFSERWQWFPFKAHKGYMLIAAAVGMVLLPRDLTTIVHWHFYDRLLKNWLT